MGTLHPKVDSAWMRFSSLASQGWSFWKEFEMREKYEAEALKRYPTEMSLLEKRRLGFRILANNQLILKERYAKIFQDTPFEALLGYLDSFDFSNCEIWERVSNLVMEYTKGV